jgi:hypothetical protein
MTMPRENSIIDIARRFQLVWNTVLAVGFLWIIIRYKLELDRYIHSIGDLYSPATVSKFLLDKWDVVILSAMFLFRFMAITKDHPKWMDYGGKCFSELAKPTEWAFVRGRWVLSWVIVSNIPIFIGLAWFTDDVMMFSAFFALHYANGVAWLVVMRRNVNAYFSDEKYVPPEADVNKRFILERRGVVQTYLYRTLLIRREILMVIIFAGTFFLVFMRRAFGLEFYLPLYTPYVIISAAEITSECLAYRERLVRDRDLDRIAVQQNTFHKAWERTAARQRGASA